MNSAQGDKEKISEDNLYQSHIAYIPINTGEFLVYYAEIMNSTTFEFSHHHHCYEIYYILQGTAKMSLAGKSFVLKKGQMMLIMPEMDHEVIYEPGVECQYFVITFDFSSRTGKDSKAYNVMLERYELDTFIRTLQVEDYYTCLDKYKCNKIIKEIQSELKNKNIGWNMKVLNLYFQFVISALRNISIGPNYPPYSRESVNSAIEITKYMHEHFNEQITLKDVAENLNMTTRNASRLFKEYFGTTFGKVLSHFRYNYAKYYLSATDYSVEDIAKYVGFESSRTILKLFKANEGLTITQYRSKSRHK